MAACNFVERPPSHQKKVVALAQRELDLQRIKFEQISVCSITSTEALTSRTEDLQLETDDFLQDAQRQQDPHWWRFADNRDDLVDVLRAIAERFGLLPRIATPPPSQAASQQQSPIFNARCAAARPKASACHADCPKTRHPLANPYATRAYGC
jgi:hypothetical protein